MANEVSLKIKVDGQELDLAKTSVNQFNEAYSAAAKKLNDLPLGSPEWKTLNSELNGAQKAFEQTKEIAATTDGKFKSLRLQIRQTTVALQEAEEKGDMKTFKKLKNDLDDLNDKLEITQLKSMKFTDALATLPGVAGVVGQSFQGLDKAFKLIVANPLLATIGALVGIFTALKESLSRTEEGSKKLAKIGEFLERVMNGLFAIIEPLANMLVDFVLGIMESKNAMKILGQVVGVTAGILAGAFNIIKTLTMFIVNNFINAFKTASGVLEGFGDVIAGVFTFDFDRIKKGVNQVKNTVVTGFNATVDNVKDTFKGLTKGTVDAFSSAYDAAEKSFEKGFKRQTKRQKELAKDAEAEAAKYKKAQQDKINADYNYQKAQDELAEAQRKKDKDRIKEIENLQAYLKKRYDADVDRINKLLALEKEGTNEYKALQAQKLAIDTKYTTDSENLAKQLVDEKKKQYEEDYKNFTEAQKQIERERNSANIKERQALDLKFAEGKISQMQYNFSVSELNKIQAQRNLANIASDKQKEKDFYAQKYAQGLIDQDTYNKNIETLNAQFREKEFAAQQTSDQASFDQQKLFAETIVQVKKDEAAAVAEFEQAKLDAIATFGGILQQIAGDNKALAIIGLLVEQGAAIADILTRAAKNKQELILRKTSYIAMAPLALLDPRYALISAKGIAATSAGLATNTLTTAASIASVAASIATGIASINGKSGGGGGGKGGGGQNLGRNYAVGGMIDGPRHAQGGVMVEAEGGEAIMTRGAVTMFRPMLSLMNQMGGGTSFGGNIVTRPDAAAIETPSMSKEAPIIKTYVVESELTNEQQKQARLKDLSTL